MNINFHIGTQISYKLVTQQIASQIGVPRQLVVIPDVQDIREVISVIEYQLHNMGIALSKKVRQNEHLILLQSEYPLGSTLAITDYEPRGKIGVDIDTIHICASSVYFCIGNLIRNFPMCKNMFIYWNGVKINISESDSELDLLFTKHNVKFTYYVKNQLEVGEIMGDVSVCEKCKQRLNPLTVPILCSEIKMEREGDTLGKYSTRHQCGRLIRTKNNMGIVVNEQCQYYAEQYLASLKAQNLAKN